MKTKKVTPHNWLHCLSACHAVTLRKVNFGSFIHTLRLFSPYCIFNNFWSTCVTDIHLICSLCNVACKNSTRDAHTLQPGEIVFSTMRHRSSETVHRLGYFQSSVSYIKVEIMFK